MNKVNKVKILIILLILLILVLGLIFYLLKRPKPKPTPSSTPAPYLEGNIGQIEFLPIKILYPNIFDTKVVYQGYFQGDLLKADIQTGKIDVLMQKKDLPDEISDIVSSPSGNKMLILGRKGKDFLGYYLFEAKNKNIVSSLYPSIKKAVFISDEKIVYHYKDAGKNSLNISDPDGKNWKKIVDIKEEQVFLFVSGANEILYTSSETTDSFNVIKTDGSGKRTIKLPILVNANKMAASSDGKSILAALREQDKATDTFYKISLETGQKQEIKYQFDAPIDAQNLILTKDGKTLYFTSDDFLYKLELLK